MPKTIGFDDLLLRSLPFDASGDRSPRQLHGVAASLVQPTPVSAPRLVAWSDEVASELGINEAVLTSPEWVAALAGNGLLPGMRPYAACYGGHQFGHWAGQLGDGRAITLGEWITPGGVRQELQLKGAGPTPYSRSADGRAVLRSSIREFLCSEAMAGLGVPTTRALSLVTTGDGVWRDMFYNGNPRVEPGAIVCRVAPSFLRFGTYQLPASRDDVGLLTELLDYTIETHFPELGPPTSATYGVWLHEVARRSAELVAEWMRVGFVHGVMNTDNMSALGLTIDYGPYGWVDSFDLTWTPNTTDAQGRRYCFGNQPRVGLWNVARLAEAMLGVIEDRDVLEASLRVYSETYEQAQRRHMRQRLGLVEEREGDDGLFAECLEVLGVAETDMTIFFRSLARLFIGQARPPGDADPLPEPLRDAWYAPDAVSDVQRARVHRWLRSYLARAAQEPMEAAVRARQMLRVNPKYVLRNYLAQEAIDAAEAGDFAPLRRLLRVLRRPYDEQPEANDLSAKRPDWARSRPGCSTLSCSS